MILIKVLNPTWHKIGHFRDVPQANLLVWYGKPNPTQQKHTFTNQNKCTTTQNKHKKTKARFSRLLRHPAWKWRASILVLAFCNFVTYLLRQLVTYLKPRDQHRATDLIIFPLTLLFLWCLSEAFLRRCQRLGYCSRETPAITELFDEADETLFGSILANSNHVLQSYLPERSLSQYNLRQRAHTKELLKKTTELNHRDFFTRMLYKDCY